MEKEDYAVKPALDNRFEQDMFDIEGFFSFDLDEHCIYSIIAGSNAYGTNTSESDLDIRGVFLPPERYVFGLEKIQQIENQKKDICYYSLKKMFELLYKNGSHALEMIFVDPKFIKVCKDPMPEILSQRNNFLSKRLAYSFGGYAWTQLMLLRTKKANNTGRIHLVEQFGYDTKLLLHAIRLFRMGSEVLTTGKLNVLRPDAEELIAIRHGKYTLDEAVQYGEVEEIDQKTGKIKKRFSIVGGLAYQEHLKFKEAMDNCVLPNSPNFDAINQLLIKIQKAHYV